MKKPQFPTKDGVMWKPQGLLWAQMCAVYGDSFVEIECQNMNLWLLKHPGNWKTCKGMPRFMNTWLARSSKNVAPRAQPRFEPGIYRGTVVQLTDEEMAALRIKTGIQ